MKAFEAELKQRGITHWWRALKDLQRDGARGRVEATRDHTLVELSEIAENERPK